MQEFLVLDPQIKPRNGGEEHFFRYIVSEQRLVIQQSDDLPQLILSKGPRD